MEELKSHRIKKKHILLNEKEIEGAELIVSYLIISLNLSLVHSVYESIWMFHCFAFILPK